MWWSILETSVQLVHLLLPRYWHLVAPTISRTVEKRVVRILFSFSNLKNSHSSHDLWRFVLNHNRKTFKLKLNWSILYIFPASNASQNVKLWYINMLPSKLFLPFGMFIRSLIDKFSLHDTADKRVLTLAFNFRVIDIHSGFSSWTLNCQIWQYCVNLGYKT